MKKQLLILSFAAVCFLGWAALNATHAAGEPTSQTFEYATIQWDGSPNLVHVNRPDSKVEFYAQRLARIAPPDGADAHSYYMNVVMNILGKEGYEFAAMTDYEIVMKKPAHL